MEFFKDTRIEFMKYRKGFAIFSAIVALTSLLAVFVQGKLNVGIDFAGGTQLIVQFSDGATSDELRAQLVEAGIEDAQIQRFGAEGSGEFMIRTPLAEGEEGGNSAEVMAALDAVHNQGSDGRFDLNQRGSDALTSLLLQADPAELAQNDQDLARSYYEEMAEAVMAVRREQGLFKGWDDLEAIEELDPEALVVLRDQAVIGSFAVLGEEVVGPTIGSELRSRGIWAVVLSLFGILGYIWVRFELRFGFGALMALIHDVTIMLGIYAVAGYEFNLSTIAAFLTLVGYSVNDTVVVFDRVRENMRRNRRQALDKTIDLSINQTLSRTVLTSGTTLLAVASIFVFGGEVLRGFSFVVMIGVVIGTYSSIFVASPFTLFWEQVMAKRRGEEPRLSTAA